MDDSKATGKQSTDALDALAPRRFTRRRLSILPGRKEATSVTGAVVQLNKPSPKHQANQLKEQHFEHSRLRFFNLRGIDENEWRQEALAQIGKMPLFSTIPAEELARVHKDGLLSFELVHRDRLLDVGDEILYVVKGQIALSYFDTETLSREQHQQQKVRSMLASVLRFAMQEDQAKAELRREMARGPLVRLARSNLLKFIEGELLDIGALRIPARLRAEYEQTSSLAAFTVSDCMLVRLTRSGVDHLAHHGQLFRRLIDNMLHQPQSILSGLGDEDARRTQIVDFYVRHGKSIGTIHRIRDLSKCIECGDCEAACEARYGKKRLSLNGKTLGIYDFVDCCQTCEEQRCVQACQDDAIYFDVTKREVVIKGEHCTGCQLCARSCPYDAIEMSDRKYDTKLWERLGREGVLAKRQEKQGRDRHLIASKCDHCLGHEDQACISACPTEALFDQVRDELFPDTTPSHDGLTTGTLPIDTMVAAEPSKYFPPGVFIPTEKTVSSGVSPSQLHRWTWLWGFSTVLLALCITEILLRSLAPLYSLQFLGAKYVMERGTSDAILLAQVRYYSSCGLGKGLGIGGTLLMIAAVSYVLRAKMKSTEKIAKVLRAKADALYDDMSKNILLALAALFSSKQTGFSARMLFRFHVWAGLFGILCIALHSSGNVLPRVLAPLSKTCFSEFSKASKVSPIIRCWANSEGMLIGGVAPILAFWIVALVGIAGVLALLLVQHTLRLGHESVLQAHGVEQELRQRYRGVFIADAEFEQRILTRFDHLKLLFPSGDIPILTVLSETVIDEVQRPWRRQRLSRELAAHGLSDPNARRHLVWLMDQLAVYQRQKILLKGLTPNLDILAKVHIFLSVILLFVGGFHVIFELFIR